MLKAAKKLLLDILFPISCFSCGKNNVWICKKCLDKIPIKDTHLCPLCEKTITPSGRICFGCRRKSSLDALLAASSYKDKLLSSAIHYYKYRFIEDLATPLGGIMIKSLLKSELPLPDIIIPVPLHKRRLRWRGFNQSKLLAEHISRKITPGLEIPISDGLIIRKRYTSPQMKIKNHRQRKNNIQNAFGISKESRKILKGKRILLVDDIATTGATLFECAKTLKAAGTKEVIGVIIARQEMN